ncbi:MAG TPA: adenosine deaminase [Terriglobia bacterium]|nr:adenosine deaminase [Terriglobia bacterium]
MAELDPTLSTFISSMPKVELHLHLEGAVRPETLLELSRNKSDLRQQVDEWIAARRAQRFRYGNFREFLVAFGIISLLLETPQDYALATTRLIEWLAEQKVLYTEIIFAAGVVLWKKQPVDATFEAVAAAAEEAGSRKGVRVKWIFDATRHFGMDHVREVLLWAARYRSHGVVALGIGGDEAGGPARLFPEIYREARDLGLHTVAHAGEACGPESIRDAVELLGAERIGHGLTALRDPNVMAMLRERRIPLEVCPSSNVSTGLIARFEDHPLPQFLKEELVVTLNSDDPGMFGTSLEEEFSRAARCFGLNQGTLTRFARNAVDASFLPPEEKLKLEERMRNEGQEIDRKI